MDLLRRQNHLNILATASVILLVVVFAIIADYGPVWIIMVLGGLIGLSVIFWAKDKIAILLYGLVFLIPTNISKAIIVSGGVYAPGLYVTLSDILLLPLFALWLFDLIIINPRSISVNIVYKVAILYWLWNIVSAFIFGPEISGTVAILFSGKFLITSFIVAEIVNSRRRLICVLYTLAAGLAVQVLMTITQYSLGSLLKIQGQAIATVGAEISFMENEGFVSVLRPTGLLGHPNVLADYLTFVLPLPILLFFIGRRYVGNWHWIGAVMLTMGGGAALVLTLSRGGWVSFFAAMLFMGTFAYRSRIIVKRHVRRSLLLFVAAVIAAVIIFPQSYQRLTQGDERSTESRLAMAEQALMIIGKNPFFGVGTGGYTTATQTIIPPSFAKFPPTFVDVIQQGVVHHKYLLVLAETGFIGLLLFMALLYFTLKLFFPISQWRDLLLYACALSIATSTFAQIVFYNFDHFYVDVRNYLFWLFLGLGVAVRNIQLRKTQQELSADD